MLLITCTCIGDELLEKEGQRCPAFGPSE